MKITKSYLKQIIKEELQTLEAINNDIKRTYDRSGEYAGVGVSRTNNQIGARNRNPQTLTSWINSVHSNITNMKNKPKFAQKYADELKNASINSSKKRYLDVRFVTAYAGKLMSEFQVLYDQIIDKEESGKALEQKENVIKNTYEMLKNIHDYNT